MAAEKSLMVQSIFWSMCAVLVLWGAITLFVEIHLGWPADRAALGHRVIGWFVNFILLRTFIRGMRRFHALKIKLGA